MKKIANEKSVPIGVKIIAILYYIGAFFAALLGILFFSGAGLMNSLLVSIPLFQTIGTTAFLIIGIILIGFAALNFFVARGLFKAKKWSRIFVIVFNSLIILSQIISIIQGDAGVILSLAINSIIVGYLLFNKDVKKAFA